MSHPFIRLPNTTIHLYRHLLREASYLPRPCHPYIAGRIKAQFRRHRIDPEPARRLQKAHHDLRYLRAANAGDMTRMWRILLLSFGRVGRRRRELLSDLLLGDPPANTPEIETAPVADRSLQEAETQILERGVDWLDKWDLDKLQALIKSQARVHFRALPRPEIKQTKLNPSNDIPDLNAWRKPWAPNVLRTKQKKWWKMMVNRVLPPLPKAEWEMLRGLAEGSLAGPEWDPPQRRVAARPRANIEDESTENAWSWNPYVLRPVRLVERGQSRPFKAMNARPEELSDVDGAAAMNLHKSTPRYWRRLYASLWHMTAIMERQPDGVAFRTTWGRPALKVASASSQQRELFEGIAPDGKALARKNDSTQ